MIRCQVLPRKAEATKPLVLSKIKEIRAIQIGHNRPPDYFDGSTAARAIPMLKEKENWWRTIRVAWPHPFIIKHGRGIPDTILTLDQIRKEVEAERAQG